MQVLLNLNSVEYTINMTMRRLSLLFSNYKIIIIMSASFILLVSFKLYYEKVYCSKYKWRKNATVAVDFEIFGRVQHVYFRKFTKAQAEKLGLRGWCMNTRQGTVVGHVQGPSTEVENMMHWLKSEGSPSSIIEKAEFRNQKEIPTYTFQDFGIRQE